jgi:outer membrane protein TolC
LQRRAARGREQAAEARLTQIDQRTRFQRDQIVAEVQDAVSAVRAAFQRVGVLTNEVVATRRVEVAERDRYELGDSNLFTLNLREISTVDAQIREVLAFADYYRAVALYELSIAQALAPAGSRP